MPRARADCSASNTTAPGSAPACCAANAAPDAMAHTSSCSTAADRKVSPAASITLLPSRVRRFASLPMEVVLPEPLTPTTRMTNGRCVGSITSGRAQGARISVSVARNAAMSASTSANSRRATRWRSDSRMCWVASTPTSAASSRVSSSSRISASMARPRTSSAISRVSQELPRLRRARKRLRKPPGASVRSLFDSDPNMDDLAVSAYCSGEPSGADRSVARQSLRSRRLRAQLDP